MMPDNRLTRKAEVCSIDQGIHAWTINLSRSRNTAKQFYGA